MFHKAERAKGKGNIKLDHKLPSKGRRVRMLGFGHHNECTGKRTIGKNGQRNTKLSEKLLLWKKLKNTRKDMQNEQDSTKTGKSRAPEVTIKIVTDHYWGR